MHKVVWVALSAGLLSACGASPVVAPEPSHDARQPSGGGMAHHEAMHDEPRERARQRWDAADTDRNGRLSRAETQASMPGLYDRFDRFDVNGDGEIAADEAHPFRIDDR
ncbi:MAG: EF-hand domain-containing protein [Lysobacterales bacterium]|jgi:hypothetical protein|nr:MAG: EF-hand domain-containing protein [Xanthomonadales bacterium]